MATILFLGEGYTAYIRHSTSSPFIELEKGVIHNLPPAWEPAEQPWLPPTYRALKIVPDVEEVPKINSEPYLEWVRAFDGAFEWFVNGATNPWDNNSDYVVTVTVGEDAVINPAPYNRVYLVNAAIIEQFGNISAFVPNSDGTVEYLLNNTDYIISLLNIPFKLPDEIAGAEEPIKLGRVDTEISAPKVEPDVIRVPLGEIQVSDLQNNSLDYLQTEYTLVLPYIEETIPLNPEWVIDKVITVEYLIDSYSGNLTVNVFNGGDSPVTFITSNIGRMIPFKTLLSSPTEQGANMGAFNDTFAAYIRVARNKVYQGKFSNLVTVEGNIGEQLGYIEVENIELNTNALTSEKEMIKRILSNGVIIK